MDLPVRRRLPRVGSMKGYGQFCPVAVASEIFAERWTPLILRELFSGSRRFGEIRSGMPLISRTLLSQRLRELEDVGVIATTPLAGGRGREYRLTTAGEEFREVVELRGVPARCMQLRTCWLVLERAGADVCMRDPGFEVDLVIHADIGALARV